MSIYHMINWFFMFSFLGYLLECVVLSYEYKVLVVNRGFVHGPFCIIYGFGALGACILLQPFAANPIKLYFAATIMATSMELITAHLMIRLFGSFWWDYSHKRLNYKGIICLQSSVAWGFLGILFFWFLNGFVHHLVDRVPAGYQKWIAVTLLTAYFLDFGYSVYAQLHKDDDEGPMIGRLKVN